MIGVAVRSSKTHFALLCIVWRWELLVELLVEREELWRVPERVAGTRMGMQNVRVYCVTALTIATASLLDASQPLLGPACEDSLLGCKRPDCHRASNCVVIHLNSGVRVNVISFCQHLSVP